MSATAARDAWGVLLPGFVGPVLPGWIEAALEEGLAGVCLFGSNVTADVRALTDAIRALRPEAVVAIDEEGGDVTRLHVADGSPEPGGAVLGRLDDLRLTAASARAIGRELAAAGVVLDLAPSVDANTDPDNPVIGARSFGADPLLVARHGAAWIGGLQGTGVAACAKHFPGHGDTAVDSHLGLPVVDADPEALAARELVPFRAAIEAGVAAVMTSHILLPRLDPTSPATTSRRILTGLLREELGFEGVIITDALDMAGASGATGIPAAAVAALAAGADLLCLGSDSADHLRPVHDAIVAAVASGALDPARLHDAAARVRALAAHHPVPASVPPDPGSGSEAGAPEVVGRAFDVRPGVRALLAGTPSWTVVRLDAVPNVAVGAAAWGPFAATGPAARAFAALPRIDVDLDGDAAPPAVEGPVLVIGRDLHRHPRPRAVVEALRAGPGPVVAVDMGWPSPDRRFADVATFGASRAVGDALLHLLADPGDDRSEP